MKVLIGGGTGFIGSALARQLKNKGHEVVVISRTQGAGKTSWDQIKREGLPPCDAVVNLAGKNIMAGLWTDSFKKEIVSSRVGTNNILKEAILNSKTPPTVFVTQSGVGYYPPSQTAEYTEDSPPGNDFIGKLAQDWEQAAAMPANHPTRTVAVRSGVVIGKGGLVQQMKLPFSLGLGGPIGSGKQYFPWVALEDEVGIFEHALTKGDLKGALNSVAPQAVTNEQFTKELAGILHRPAFFRVPGFVISTLLGSDRAVMLLEGQKVLPKRTTDTGYKFKFPTLTEALKEALK